MRIEHMKKLRQLNAAGQYCGIDQEGIQGLDLERLSASHNPKITSVAHMKQLRKLDAGWECGIDQEGIKGLDLEKLSIYGNSKIIDTSFMKNLKELNGKSIN